MSWKLLRSLVQVARCWYVVNSSVREEKSRKVELREAISVDLRLARVVWKKIVDVHGRTGRRDFESVMDGLDGCGFRCVDGMLMVL